MSKRVRDGAREILEKQQIELIGTGNDRWRYLVGKEMVEVRQFKDLDKTSEDVYYYDYWCSCKHHSINSVHKDKITCRAVQALKVYLGDKIGSK